MPVTYNGIGTHYYGKKNLQTRRGTCRNCGHTVDLLSYDTRLWFVVIYIPLIPLGRKRILDYCPACRRHYAVEADKWETAKQLEVSGAMEAYRANPTAEAAVAVHQQLINFHQLEEAAQFRKLMTEKYSDNAKVQAYLGSVMLQFQKNEESAAFYARALELRPDLPEARVGVARHHMGAGRLDEARALLDFLEKPGAAQLYSLEPLETLAHAYQNKNRHEQALAIFAKLQEAVPDIAQHDGFRKSVKKSEKAMGKKDSLLLKRQFSLRRLFGRGGGRQVGQAQLTWRSLLGLGIAVSLVMLGFVIANEYIRRHRVLHIVNAYSQPATVQIAGVGNFARIHGREEVALPEGHYHAVISGPIQQEVDFDLRAGYFSRWFSDPAWVLNIGGAAVIMEEAVVYGRNPPPGNITFHFGKPFEHIGRVTHPFQTLPQSVTMNEGETRTLVELGLYTGEGAELFGYFVNHRQAGEAVRFAETWLLTHFDDEQVLMLYIVTAGKRGESNRVDTFIHNGLAARPVRTEWHRVYQQTHNTPAGHAALAAEYDGLLRADPTNSALLYLCGRLATDRAACRDYFDRAVQADQNNPYPVFALGYDRMVAGDWAGAKPLLERAVKLQPKDESFEDWLVHTRLALGEAGAIEQDMRKRLAQNPLDFLSTMRVIEALAIQDKRDEALRASADYEQRSTRKFGAEARAVVAAIRFHTYYALGDFAELERAAKAENTSTGRRALAEALIEEGRVDEAIKALPTEDEFEDKPIVALAVAVAYRQAGNLDEARRWTKQAQDLLQNDNQNHVNLANLLNDAATPTLKQAEELSLRPMLKAVLLAEVALQHPEARADLAPLALRLNVDRNFPYHLVQKAMSEKK